MNLNNRIKYTNTEYGITIIEIKSEDNKNDYLELDENIMKEGNNILYVKNSIYIIQYKEGKKLGVSYGVLKEIYKNKEYNFKLLSCKEKGSSGSPIINLNNNKVFGINKWADPIVDYNIGLFLNYVIRDIINKNELNTRYNLNIKNFDNLEKLDLSSKEISNIEILDKIRLDNLKELNLNDKQISDITVFEKIAFDKLETLNISENQISDINALAKAKYENIKFM